MVSALGAPPSPDYLALVGTAPSQLAVLMRRGGPPAPGALTGWEWRGTNMPASSRFLGLRRFIKGFERLDDGRIEGYNVAVAGSDLAAPWRERRQRDGRREWARFAVAPVDPSAPDNRYLDALLFDYGAATAPEGGIAGRLRDYVVRVAPGSDDLLLGHAFLAVGGRRVAIGWFALERLGPRPPSPGA